jgi:hypothetical protein
MVGGTKLPPRDSKNEPWWHEQKSNPNPKTLNEGKNKTLRSL